MSGGANAGWYPDPGGSGLYRWFDGQRWTEHVERGTWPSPVQAAAASVAASGLSETPPAPVTTAAPSTAAAPIWQSSAASADDVEVSSISFGRERPEGPGRRRLLVWLAVPAVLVLVGVLALAVVLVRGSGGTSSSAYPAQAQASFVSACMANGGGDSYCQCAVAQLQKHIPLSQFEADENTYLTTGAFTPDMSRAVQTCS